MTSSPTSTIRRNSGGGRRGDVGTGANNCNKIIDWSGYLGAGTTTFRAAASPTRRPPKKTKAVVRIDKKKQKEQQTATTKQHVSSSSMTTSLSPNLIIQKNPLKRHNSTGSVCGPALTTVSSTSTLLSKISLVDDDSECFTPSSPRSQRSALIANNSLMAMVVPHDYEYHENHAKLHEAYYNNTYNMDIPYYNYDCTTRGSMSRSSNSNNGTSPHDNRQQVQVQVQVQQQEEKKRRNSDNGRLVLLHQNHVATNKCKIVQVVETHNDQQLHYNKRHSTSSNTLNTTSNSSASSSSSSSSRHGSNTTTSKSEIKTTAEKVKQHIPYTSSSSNNNNNNNNINDADQSHASTTAPSTTPQSSCSSSSSISSPSSSFSLFVSYVKDKFLTKQQYKSKVNHLQKYRMIQTKK